MVILTNVLALLAACADVSRRCGEISTTTVMHVAAEMGHVDILMAVIEHGADIDGGGTATETQLSI